MAIWRDAARTLAAACLRLGIAADHSATIDPNAASPWSMGATPCGWAWPLADILRALDGVAEGAEMSVAPPRRLLRGGGQANGARARGRLD